MENCMMTSPQLIADSYERYHFSVYLYIYNKVNNKEEAEDLSQDVFVRLMDYKQMLRPDTVKFFIYTISRNLVKDARSNNGTLFGTRDRHISLLLDFGDIKAVGVESIVSESHL